MARRRAFPVAPSAAQYSEGIPGDPAQTQVLNKRHGMRDLTICLGILPSND